jgi:hypothetical protein
MRAEIDRHAIAVDEGVGAQLIPAHLHLRHQRALALCADHEALAGFEAGRRRLHIEIGHGVAETGRAQGR